LTHTVHDSQSQYALTVQAVLLIDTGLTVSEHAVSSIAIAATIAHCAYNYGGMARLSWPGRVG